MSNDIGKIEATDLLEVQSWLTGWGDYCNRGTVGGHLGYQSPMAKVLNNNVQQSRERSRPVLWDMNDEAYYTLIDRELAGMRQSGDKELMMWAKIIRHYYLYGMSYTKLSKSVVSEYEHGEGTTKRSHVRKVREHLGNAERHIYEAVLVLS
ncbi:hypothetical protein [Psychrobacter pocilloporae]|uniref:Phage antitermination protein Q n=2 Tax=Psychrobacter TaxID=497 RepID=A0ABT6ISW5_9GAMM|nr:hypothetical protein [Psychrobacter pocilloporae]MDH4904142.1 hypothetical protein [Psychrobacter pocilloporae]